MYSRRFVSIDTLLGCAQYEFSECFSKVSMEHCQFVLQLCSRLFPLFVSFGLCSERSSTSKLAHVIEWTWRRWVLSAFFYCNTIELRSLRFPVLDMHPLCVADTYERRWVSNAFFYYNTFVHDLTFVAEVRTLRVNVISVCVEYMYANDVRKRKIWLMW